MYCEPGSQTVEANIAANPRELLGAALRKHATVSEREKWHWQSKLIRCDDASDCITREASRYGADLIVMRSRRRPHRAALLGSVAESVSRTAPRPVMVIHTDERDWIEGDGRQIGLKRVLVAFDFSDHSEQALKLGLLISQEYQAELHLLHVLPPFTLNEPEISWYPLGSEGVYHKAARRLQNAVPNETQLWCKIKTSLPRANPIARSFTTLSETKSISYVSGRRAQVSDCSLC